MINKNLFNKNISTPLTKMSETCGEPSIPAVCENCGRTTFSDKCTFYKHKSVEGNYGIGPSLNKSYCDECGPSNDEQLEDQVSSSQVAASLRNILSQENFMDDAIITENYFKFTEEDTTQSRVDAILSWLKGPDVEQDILERMLRCGLINKISH